MLSTRIGCGALIVLNNANEPEVVFKNTPLIHISLSFHSSALRITSYSQLNLLNTSFLPSSITSQSRVAIRYTA